jgi:3-oxoacyl-[acyl-carrier-protein] synthase-3
VKFGGTKYGWSDRLLTEPEAITKDMLYPLMNGNFVFKHAVTRFPESLMEALNKAGKKPEDLDMFIPHQANLRISQFVQQKWDCQTKKFSITSKNMVTLPQHLFQLHFAKR